MRLYFAILFLTSALSAAEFPGTATTGTVTRNADNPFPLRGSFVMFDREMPSERWGKELDSMQDVGMDTLVVLAVGHLRKNSNDPLGYSPSSDGMLFQSKWAAAHDAPAADRLEMILSLADKRGMKVYVGSMQTESDWTTGLELAALRAYNERIAAEIIERYASHQSLTGWYFPQEIWMNWVKYYGQSYYGTAALRDFVADMKRIDPTKAIAATVVFKKTGGAPPIDELSSYFAAHGGSTH